jgi:hypothetical protein
VDVAEKDRIVTDIVDASVLTNQFATPRVLTSFLGFVL